MPFWSKAASALSKLFGGSAPATHASPPATVPGAQRKSSRQAARATPATPPPAPEQMPPKRSAREAPSEPVPPSLPRSPQSKPAEHKVEAATPILATASAHHTASPASKPAGGAQSQRCPHGKRRREFCPICDPDGYRRNFGDWLND